MPVGTAHDTLCVLHSPLFHSQLSFGGSYSSALNDGVQALKNAGAVVVVAAGNEATDA